MTKYNLRHLDKLEAEAIFIMREVAAQFERAALMFSGGKDSILMGHLAYKSFFPAKIPFQFLHIDTGHNFPETIEYRDNFIKKLGAQLIVGSVEESIRTGRVLEETGKYASRIYLQTTTLLDTIEEHKFDCCIGGGRRDEEKARAKERFFSHRNEFGEWDPKNQRPELWNLYNGKCKVGEHFRVFPLSNWTEMDVWQYIQQEQIEIPKLYFSHNRKCFHRDGVILAYSPYINMEEDEKKNAVEMEVRCRTVGDMNCTGFTKSRARTVEEIVIEVAQIRSSERGTRADDKRSETAMEDRKKEGYF